MEGTTSVVEVQNISPRGFWPFVEVTARDYFLPFSEFPWFKQATIAGIIAVQLERGHILHWQKLDAAHDLCHVSDRYTDEEDGSLRTTDTQAVMKHETHGVRLGDRAGTFGDRYARPR